MTAEDIAAQLPQLADGPHDDASTIALTQIAAEAIRALNHATAGGRGLTDPATVYTLLGQLAAAAHRLPQLCGQLAGWLGQENTAGRLAHSTGGLDDILDDILASLDRAAQHATRLGEALDLAHQGTAWLHWPTAGGENR